MKLNSLFMRFAALFRWPDLNNPPTAVGGIQELDHRFVVGGT